MKTNMLSHPEKYLLTISSIGNKNNAKTNDQKASLQPLTCTLTFFLTNTIIATSITNSATNEEIAAPDAP